MRRRFEAPFYIHKNDEVLVGLASQTATMYGLPPVEVPDIDGYVGDGDAILFGETEVKVIATPGHSAGGVCYLIPEMNVVIVGDTLFRESIGRTDFPYADHSQLLSSIKEKLFVLDDGLQAITGHGEFTTIGHEKQYNPFLR